MTRTLLIGLILFIQNNIILSNAARILAVFPVPSISHQVVFRPLTQELAKRGHEVVILTPDPAFPNGKTPNNLSEIDVHDQSYAMWIDNVVNKIDGDPNSANKVMEYCLNALVDIFEMQINSPEFRKVIRSGTQFDLIFTEACVKTALVISHIFKAPVIQISSLGGIHSNFEVIGAPTHPLLYPEMIRQRLYDLSLWEKINGIYEEIRFRYVAWSLEEKENAMIKRNFGPGVPDISELMNNVNMLFLNIHPIWDDNRAVPPGVIFMGGLHQKPEKSLPEDLKAYLDNSEHGVIYMSFGTNVKPSQLPIDRISVFIKVFSTLPYDVLWKWDIDMPQKPDNVRLTKWAPQSDLLRHPKVKLFITQAGLQSTDEAITAGVPLIAFPILVDQWFNAEKYVRHRIGLKLDLGSVTEQLLNQSINTIIEDKSVRQNIVKLRRHVTDQPQTPLDRAVWWTEYVIRHKGAKYLRSAAANISWSDYIMLDVLVTVTAIILIGVFVSVKLLTFLIGRVSALSMKEKRD